MDSVKVDALKKIDENQLLSPQSNGGAERAPLKVLFIIGVADGTASGKTTLCNMIISQLHDQWVVLVNQDAFYRSLSAEQLHKVAKYNFDHPDASDTECLLSCVETLRHGKTINVPHYDFKIHKIVEPGRVVNPSDVITLERIFVLHDYRVGELMNMKVFVDTDSDLCLSRRIKHDTVERGRNIKNILDQYAKFVKPTFEEFILPSKKYVDVIIPRGVENDIAIDLIVQHILTKLGQHDLFKIYPNTIVISSTFQIREMHTLVRDDKTTKHDLMFYTDRLIRLVVEHCLDSSLLQDLYTLEWISAKDYAVSQSLGVVKV